MSAEKFFHIYISPKVGITTAQVEAKMNLSLDWIRYAPKSYIVYSNSEVEKLRLRFLDLIESGGELLICELSINNRSGMMEKMVWNWLQKKRP